MTDIQCVFYICGGSGGRGSVRTLFARVFLELQSPLRHQGQCHRYRKCRVNCRVYMPLWSILFWGCNLAGLLSTLFFLAYLVWGVLGDSGVSYVSCYISDVIWALLTPFISCCYGSALCLFLFQFISTINSYFWYRFWDILGTRMYLNSSPAILYNDNSAICSSAVETRFNKSK